MKTATAVSAEGRTRARVARLLMERGATTASDLAAELGLSTAAVRRHLDAMLADGSIVPVDAEPSGSPRRRGRPARSYALSDSGREAFPQGYDDLAASALRFLAREGGGAGVAAFLADRVRQLEDRYRDRVVADDPAARATLLAVALSEDGYAATAVDGQVCQHHCPVQHVAEEFPQLCEAETEVFARLIGTEVSRTTTIAHGGTCCTATLALGPTRSTTDTPPTPPPAVAGARRTSR